IAGLADLPERNVLLVGARDLDTAEAMLLDGSQLERLPPEQFDGGLETKLASLAERARDLYLHIDLDVLDPQEGRANEDAAPGGLSVTQVERRVAAAGARFHLRAAALTAYDPSCDADGRIARAGVRLLAGLGQALLTAGG